MPQYPNPTRVLPRTMQDVLAALGLSDPRSMMPGPPLMTVGPRAIPLDLPNEYMRKVLSEVTGDLTQAPSTEFGENVINKITRQGWDGNKLANGVIDLAKEPQRHRMVDFTKQSQVDDMINWLAQLFHGGI